MSEVQGGPLQGPSDASTPFAGVRVLDLTGLLPGPYASLLLADQGANVVKVESRLGDVLRQVPPLIAGVGAYFLSINRNKRSLGLDLRRPEAVALFRKLAVQADVVLESFRPGRAARMGIGPEDLMGENPRLIYCSLSGFGQTGPDALRPGHDLTYLARSGVLGLGMRDLDGPTLPSVQMADLAAGTTAAYAIAAALFERERTGAGQFIDLAILDSITAWMGFHLQAHRSGLSSEAGALPLSGRYPFYNVYATADGGFVALGALEPLFWREFCQAVDRPDLVPLQFVGGPDRIRLFEEVADIMAARTRDEWRALIRARSLSAEVVAGGDEVLEDEQLSARGMIRYVTHPVAGELVQVASPVGRGAAAAREGPPTPPPALGEHTRAVLTELLDLTEVEVDNLVRDRVIFESSEPGRRIAPESVP